MKHRAQQLFLSVILVLFFIIPNTSYALSASHWWEGSWSCKIDGRPAHMTWKMNVSSPVSCNGQDCAIAHDSSNTWSGNFSDNGSAWVSLTNPSEGIRGGMTFYHADGNKWYLDKPKNDIATGWTTWNNKRFSLSCQKLEARCVSYAKLAVSQHNEVQQYSQCFSKNDPRWQENYSNHYNWCLTVFEPTITKEELGRSNYLENCKKQTSRFLGTYKRPTQ